MNPVDKIEKEYEELILLVKDANEKMRRAERELDEKTKLMASKELELFRAQNKLVKNYVLDYETLDKFVDSYDVNHNAKDKNGIKTVGVFEGKDIGLWPSGYITVDNRICYCKEYTRDKPLFNIEDPRAFIEWIKSNFIDKPLI